MNAINEEYYPTPLGKQELNGEVVQLTVDHFTSLDEMNKIFVGKDRKGASLFLKDIAEVKVAPKEIKDVVTFEGKPSVSFTAFVQPGKTFRRLMEESVIQSMNYPKLFRLILNWFHTILKLPQ